MKRFTAVVFLCICSLWSSPALALDFDGDGIDDLTLVSINANKSLSWRYQSSRTQRVVALGRHGVVGNDLIPGRWATSLTPVLGVISADTTDKTLWQFKTRSTPSANSKRNLFSFGSKNALVMSGADFDGDGIFDPLTIDQQDGQLLWSRSSVASETEPDPASTNFGTIGDLPFIWHRANATAQYAVLKHQHTGGGTIEIMDINDQVRSITLGSIPFYSEPPQTIVVGRKTYLVFSYKGFQKTYLTIYRETGSVIRSVTLNGTGTILVGNFDKATSGQEIALHTGGDLLVASIFSPTVKRRRAAAGIPVDESNSQSVGTFGNIVEDTIAASCERHNPNDGYKRAFIWKPNSDTQRFAVAVLPHSFAGSTKDIEIFRADTGAYIRSIVSKGCSNPDDEGVRCAYQERELTGQEYRAQYGSILLKAYRKDGSCAVFTLKDPSKRID